MVFYIFLNWLSPLYITLEVITIIEECQSPSPIVIKYATVPPIAPRLRCSIHSPEAIVSQGAK